MCIGDILKNLFLHLIVALLITTAASTSHATLSSTNEHNASAYAATIGSHLLDNIFSSTSSPISATFSRAKFKKWLKRFFAKHGNNGGGNNQNPGNAVSVPENFSLALFLLAIFAIGLVWIFRANRPDR